MRAPFTIPGLPVNPLLRAVALAGIAIILIGLLTVGLVVGVTGLAAAALMLAFRRWQARRTARNPDPTIIEGEFTVVNPRPRVGLPHAE
ncbi:MAG: hypothetical protein EPN36_03060 [Rhodanobacteraceae bacterium]|nr:MAG: hypothetical protein EPN36_03060 [Rhodanobacteraceae bacterium]